MGEKGRSMGELSKKICRRCKIGKEFCEYNKNKWQKDGLNNACRVCSREIQKKYYLQNKERFKARFKKWLSKNKDKDRIRCKKWEDKNREKLRIKSRIEYRKNREEILRKSKEYDKRHREKANARNRERYKNDMTFRMTSNIRRRMLDLLKENCKSGKSLELLGCTVQFLRGYLQSKFLPGMSWENYGYGNDKWNIDHITPCSHFNLSIPEDQKKCFHFTNLQPLWQIDNQLKGDRYTG